MDKVERHLETIIALALAAIVLVLMSGCAGELYMGTRRIDEYQATQTMKNQPLKCLFVECGGMEK